MPPVIKVSVAVGFQVEPQSQVINLWSPADLLCWCDDGDLLLFSIDDWFVFLRNGSLLILSWTADLVVVLGKNLIETESAALLVHRLLITSRSGHFSLERVKVRVFLIYFYLQFVDLFLGGCTLRKSLFLFRKNIRIFVLSDECLNLLWVAVSRCPSSSPVSCQWSSPFTTSYTFFYLKL